MDLNSNIFLTSIVIPPTADGNYTWYESDWLIPHETIRRETLRLERALEKMDILFHRWQILNLYTWCRDFYIPALLNHHDVEENIVGKHFEKVGVVADFGQNGSDGQVSHEALIAAMNAFTAKSEELYKLSKVDGPLVSSDELTKIFEECKQLFVLYHKLLVDHLAAEERYWPEQYKAQGKAVMDGVKQQIISGEMKLKGEEAKQAHAFIGAIIEQCAVPCMKPEKYPPLIPGALNLPPWHSPEYGRRFWDEIPFIPKTFIFPSWQKEYVLKWKVMIDSVCGPDDVLQLGSPKLKNCSCLIV